MVDVHAWGACGEIRGGSSPPIDTIKIMRLNAVIIFIKQMARTKSQFRVQRPVSRVRRSFAKRIKFFEAKSEDTFNANRARQVPPIDNFYVVKNLLFGRESTERKFSLIQASGERTNLKMWRQRFAIVKWSKSPAQEQ